MSVLQGSPVRLDRLQRALIEVLGDGLGSDVQVAWAYGEGVFDATFPNDFVNLTMGPGPNYVIRSGARGRAMYPPSLLTFTVGDVVVGQRYTVYLNNFAYFHDAVLADTADTIRTALVASIVADPESPYTAAPTVTAGQFTVTPDFNGAIWQASLPNPNITASVVLSENAVLLTEGRRLCTVSHGVFSKVSSIRAGAWALATKIQAIYESTDYSEALNAYGVGIGSRSILTDLTALANGTWESRVNLDVDLSIQSVHVRPVDTIDTVNVGFSGSNPPLVTTFTVGPLP